MTSSRIERFRRDGFPSRIRGFRERCAVAFLLLAATPPPMARAAAHSRKYVDQKNGFQLEVPQKWKKVQAGFGPLPGRALAAFAVQKKHLGVAVMRLKSPVGVGDEFAVTAALKQWSNKPGYYKVSEGVTKLSGLSARKIVFDSYGPKATVQSWALFVFGHREVWLLFLQGPEQWLSRPGNAHARQMKAIIQSFKFLEPTLSNLQGEAFAQEFIGAVTNAMEAVALTARGQELDQKGRKAEAISAWRKALQLDPKNFEAHFRLAVALATNPQTRPEAAEHFKAFLKYVEQKPEEKKRIVLAHALLADLASFAGRQGESAKELEEALRVDPDDAHILNQAAWLYATAADPQVKNPQKALDYAKKAVAKSNRRNTDYLDTLAEAYWVNGRYQDAARQYEDMIRIDPGNADYLNEAAWLYATAKDPRARNPQKAVHYAREAVASSRGKDPAILDTLAEAFYASGQYDEAVQTEEKALALKPTEQVQVYKDHLKKYKHARKKFRLSSPR